MARVTTAQTRRRQRRAAAAKAASKPTAVLDQDALAEHASQPDDFAEIARLATEALPPIDVRARRLELVAAAGLEDTPSATTTTYELTNGSLAERKFLAEAIDAGYTEYRTAGWPSEGTLEDHGEVLFRSETSGVFRLDDGTIVYASISYGWCNVKAYAPTRVDAAGTIEAFSVAYPPLYRETSEDGTIVPITFWTDGRFGPTSRLRMIDSASWGEIEGNYTADVRDELARLMNDFEPGKDGQLLLWQGSPGTGKTWALRALASEWRDWAEFSYITDPDAFFVDNPSYMIDVLLSDSYESLTVDGDVVTDQKALSKWRVLILEDTGELLSANAKEAYGQGLSRLLNVVDGMVGQGLRVLALVTTNDELGDLHPAATRPGRCASQLEFGPLSADEATAWGVDTDEPMTLAELFAASKKPAAEAFAARADCANCDHAFADHLGSAGPCTMADCSCNGYDAPASDTAALEPDEADDAPDELVAAATEMMPFTLQFLPDGFVDVLSKGPLGPAELAVLAKLAAGDAQSVVPAPAPGAEIQVVEPEKVEPVTAGVRWTAIFCPEGSPTDDGRVFAPGSITWRELPLTLMGMIETAPGHDGATVCGRIDNIWKQGGLVLASGVFDTGEFGSEIARLVGDGTLRGLSVDIAITELDVTYKSEVIDKDGNWIGGDVPPSQQEAAEGPDPIGVMFDPADSPMYVVWGGVIGAATVCPFPAFGGASIEIDAPLVAGGAPRPMLWRYTLEAGFVVTRDGKGELLASAAPAEAEAEPADMPFAPLKPPAGWFTNPQLEGPTPLTIDDDGHIYGHAAEWDVCHIGIPGVCTTAPESKSGYALYHLKEVECAEGERVSVGTITFDTGHAGKRLSRADALAHYDHTGSAVADVVVGEDEHGIWFAGAMRPTVTEEQLRVMRGAVLSGDWRNVDGDLELVALLAVNVPGFPVKRVHALVASGADGSPEVLSLIAAGIPDGTLSALHRAELQALADSAAGTFDDLAADAA